MRNIVQLSKKANKNLRKAPMQVQQKAALWKILVESKGLQIVRLIKGFHDSLSGVVEPVRGLSVSTYNGEQYMKLASARMETNR